MTDGAHQGVSAKRALDTILGGAEQPGDDEQRNPDEMRVWLLAADGPPFADGGEGYEHAARYAGRLFLEAFLADPSLTTAPIDTLYDWEGDPDHGTRGMKPEFVRKLDLSARLDREYPDVREKLRGLGLSGFQWGWAVNAARYCVELGPEPNPAIIELDV